MKKIIKFTPLVLILFYNSVCVSQGHLGNQSIDMLTTKRYLSSVSITKPAVFYINSESDLYAENGFGFDISFARVFDNYSGNEHAFHIGIKSGYVRYRNYDKNILNRANTIGAFLGFNDEESIFASLHTDYLWQEKRFASYASIKGLINESIGNLFKVNSFFYKITNGLRVGVEIKAGLVFSTITDNNPFVGVSLSLNTQQQ